MFIIKFADGWIRTRVICSDNYANNHCPFVKLSLHVPSAVQICISTCKRVNIVFPLLFFQWAIPSLFLIYFWFYSNEHDNFYNKSMWKNVHPVYSVGIRTHVLCESNPITTRPTPSIVAARLCIFDPAGNCVQTEVLLLGQISLATYRST